MQYGTGRTAIRNPDANPRQSHVMNNRLKRINYQKQQSYITR